MRSPRLRPVAYAFLWGLLSVCPAWGQDATVERDSEPKLGDETPTADPKSTTRKPDRFFDRVRELSGDVVFLPTESGELVPVPRGADLDEYLEFVRRRARKAADAGEAGYAVVRVAVEGTADDETARLSVRFQVKVDRDDGWVSVPLGLGQTIVRDYAYRRVGDPSLDADSAEEARTQRDGSFESFDDEAGLRWRFRGRGLHEVTVEVAARVRFQSPTRRLTLALPETAVSSAKIEVPFTAILIDPDGDTQAGVRGSEKGRSVIEVFGLSSRLELQWAPKPAPRSKRTSMQVNSLFEIRPNERSIVSTVTQTVQVTEGAVERLRLSLPTDFEVLDLSGRFLDETGGEFTAFEADEKGEWATVELPEVAGVRRRIELRWTLETEDRGSSRRVRINGLSVERATRQTGEIAVMPLAGRNLISIDAGERNVHRIDVAEVSRVGDASSAFRFLRQPFELVLDSRTIEPLFTSEPRFSLEARADRLVLSGRFHIRLYRGVLSAVEVGWANHRADGWTVEMGGDSEITGESELLGTGDEERIRLALLQARSGEFEIPFRAERSLDSIDEPVRVRLPTVLGAQHLASELVVVRPVDVEASLKPAGTTRTRPIPTASVAVSPAADGSGVVDSAVRVESGERVFDLALERRSRRTVVESRLVATPGDGRLRIVQTFAYDVQYGVFSELVVAAPAATARSTLFRSEGREPLPVVWNDEATADGSLLGRIAFPKEAGGVFRLSAAWEVTFGDLEFNDAAASVDVGLVRPVDADEFRQSCSVRSNGVDDFVWRPVGAWAESGTDSSSPLWTATEAPVSLKFAVTPAGGAASGRLVVQRALVRTVFDPFGNARTTAHFALEGDADRAVLVLPRLAVVERIQFGGATVTGEERRDGRISVPIGRRERTSNPVLTVVLHTQGELPFTWVNARVLEPPRLENAAWTASAVWEVAVPADQYLMRSPAGYAPGYEWQRRFAVWSREPRPEFADTSAWMGGIRSDPSPDGAGVSNVYHFSRVGALEAVTLETSSRSLVILLGAGTALAVGFVLLKIPATRHVTTLLTIGFVLAVASTWYGEIVVLALQPALLGSALACLAAFIDSLFSRGRGGALVTFHSGQDTSSSDVLEASTRTQAPGAELDSASQASLDFELRPTSSHLTGSRGGS